MLTLPGIQLSNGHVLRFVAASGALGYDGRGWWWERMLPKRFFDPLLFDRFAKTVTFDECIGYFRYLKPWDTLRFLPSFLDCQGTVNTFGLRNDGHRWLCREVLPKLDHDLAVSIHSDNPDELAIMAGSLKDYPRVFAVENNGSCPNVERGLSSADNLVEGCRRIKEAAPNLPLILKISVAHREYLGDIIPKVKGIVEAIAFNSVPWKIAFPDRESPLAHHGGGGVSGQLAQLHNWALALRIQLLYPYMPVIWPDMWYRGDMESAIGYGAKAVSCGALFLRHPTRPTCLVRDFLRQNKSQRR